MGRMLPSVFHQSVEKPSETFTSTANQLSIQLMRQSFLALDFPYSEFILVSDVGKNQVLTFSLINFLLLFDSCIIFKIGLFWGKM
jgi:hypothetical protein